MSSNIPQQVHEFTVYAGYHQFHLQDENPGGNTGEAGFWTQEKCHRMISATSGIVGVGTASYGNVPVRVEVWGAEPEADYDKWDHVAEAGLELKSGQLVVNGCPDEPAGRVALAPGLYRVRIYSGGLDTVGDGDEGDDYYRVAVWEADDTDPMVIKQWAHAPPLAQ